MSEATRDATTSSTVRPADGDGRWPLDWQRLLRLAAIVEGVAVLVVAAFLGDLEAAVIGLGFGVGLALLSWRQGVLGMLGIGLLSANVLAWMALGTYSNLVDGSGWHGLLIPGVLTSLSLLGVSAAVGAGLARRRRGSAGRGPAVVVVAAAVLLALVLAAGAAGSGEASSSLDGDLELVTSNLSFSDEQLSADAGEVAVVVRNADLFWHTFTIDELDVDVRVPVTADRHATFDAPPGTYDFYCRVPGHETVMRGTLTVH
ncbi:MAG: cupredoxin domain-containing protein [Actinomycetota bacterium]|jgi:plastocyanin|nr:cupredoxin domain-containing protein [Actinomycetota bacterium]